MSHYKSIYNLFCTLRPCPAQYVVIATILVLCTGCLPVQSLHPLYSPDMEEVVFEPALLGTWGDKNEEDFLVFKQSGEMAYHVEFISPKDELEEEFGQITNEKLRKALLHSVELEAHLVKLQGYLFLDLYMNKLYEPASPILLANPFFALHTVPTHTFYRVWLEDDNLSLALLYDEFFPLSQNEKDGIRYDTIKNDDLEMVLLTSDTSDLQKFVIRHAEDDSVFPRPDKPVYRITTE